MESQAKNKTPDLIVQCFKIWSSSITIHASLLNADAIILDETLTAPFDPVKQVSYKKSEQTEGNDHSEHTRRYIHTSTSRLRRHVSTLDTEHNIVPESRQEQKQPRIGEAEACSILFYPDITMPDYLSL